MIDLTSCTRLATDESALPFCHYSRSNADPPWKSALRAVAIQKSTKGLTRLGSESLRTYSIEMSQHLVRQLYFPKCAYFVVSCRITPKSSGNFGVNQLQTVSRSFPHHSIDPLIKPDRNSHIARILCRSYTFVVSISVRYPSQIGLIASNTGKPKSWSTDKIKSICVAEG
jgi:hypothetical protein